LKTEHSFTELKEFRKEYKTEPTALPSKIGSSKKVTIITKI
jgi:hypothetical protein